MGTQYLERFADTENKNDSSQQLSLRVAGTTQHEGAVELLPAVAPMGIAINCYILFMDFSAGRSGGSMENPGKLLHQAPGGLP
jgi:hypothetical protein